MVKNTKSGSKDTIILDKAALKAMGLSGECFWLIEYDIPSAVKNHHTKEISKKYTKEQAKFFRDLRNSVMYQLKLKLNATKNLYSSWFISEDNLKAAKDLVIWIRSELEAAGFPEKADKTRIFPLLTDQAGAEAFYERKAEFLLQWCEEQIVILEKGIKAKTLGETALWRCKKTFEIVDVLKGEIKGKPRFNELVDVVAELDRQISTYEAIKEAKKARKAKK